MTPTARAFMYLGAVGACALFAACTPSAGISPTPSSGVSTPAGQSAPPETEQQRKERLDFEAAEKAIERFEQNTTEFQTRAVVRPNRQC